MRKFHLSGALILGALALAVLPAYAYGVSAETIGAGFAVAAIASMLVMPDAYAHRIPGMIAGQRGAAGDGGGTLEIAALEKALMQNVGEFKKFAEKAEGEIKAAGDVSRETKATLEKIAEAGNKLGERLDKLEAKADRALNGGEAGEKSLGTRFVESDECKALMGNRVKQARMQVKAIVNATGQNQPLSPSLRVPGIIAEPNRRLTVRDLLLVGRTTSNLIEFTKENVFSNGAAPQYEASPERFEAVKKAESTITFTLANAAVITLAHFIKASKQVLGDAPQLESYINGRLIYGLKLKEEDSILNGDGSAGQLTGLRAAASSTPYNRGATDDTRIDTLRKVMTQCALSEYSCSGFVLNPADWEAIELTKDTQGRYIAGDPNMLLSSRLWTLPIVVTNSMPQGSFLGGAFDMAAQLWDREEAAVQVGFENDDFTKNLVTILAEERLALTVYRAAALIRGTFGG